MSISSAFNSALSGLTAAGRASAIVSENIANAMTPGYARRSLSVASLSEAGAGVKVVGVVRHADPGIVANRRSGDAAFGSAKTLADFHTRFSELVGTTSDPQSISTRLANFESSLIAAASRPDSPQRLDAVAYSARDLADGISRAADGVRSMRTQADRSIGVQVDRLNQALGDVQKLNTRITATQSSGGNTAALLDQRQMLVDEINEIVPISEVNREYGQIALYTDGGAILLDGPAATLSFNASNDTLPEMTLQNGALSGLEINGISVRTSGANSAIPGGSLAAQFQVRDELSVSAQVDLDSVARDLVERFETATLDPTTGAGDAGLFTDNGSAFDPLAETGLAGRLTLNQAVDPTQDGESWRLRAGLGAADPGQPGDASLLQAFGTILNDSRMPPSGNFGTGQLTAAGLGTSLLSRAAQNSNVAEQTLSFASASKNELSRIELEQGVDTDAELQMLMIIEQAYAANARVIEAADDMMQSLLRL